MEEVEGGSERSDVAGNVAETTKTGAFEAVLGNGFADLLDCEVGNLELVAVGIKEDTAGVLDLSRALVHGRQGGVR